MTDDAALIRIEGLSKRYGTRTVLNVPAFDIKTGDRVLLIGANGCGKSTLLRILAGISNASGGTIKRSFRDRSMRLGFVPQAGGLYEDMTLRQNLTIFRWLYGVEVGLRENASDFVADTGLAQCLDMAVGQLSGGLQQLAAIACVLATNPDALLLDEPTSELDDAHAGHLTDKLRELSGTLQFLVVATHQLSGFEFLQRRVFMAAGEIVRIEGEIA